MNAHNICLEILNMAPNMDKDATDFALISIFQTAQSNFLIFHLCTQFIAHTAKSRDKTCTRTSQN